MSLPDSGVRRARSAGAYKLCFGCHDVRLVQDEQTEQFTGFGNGATNLHHLHANRDERDRGCPVCHVTHAAPGERLVRASIPYGRWLMPMQFERTETGGSCFPGCHPRAAYDRENPVVRAGGGPMTRASPRIARAQHEPGRAVARWSFTDAAGAAIELPHPSKPTVLLFAGADDGETIAELSRRLARGATPGIDAQRVVIVCGERAEAAAQALRASAGSSAAILADPSLDVATAFDVHGWPIVLVLRADGLELARLTGSAATLELTLPDYLRHAAGAAVAQGQPDLAEPESKRVERAMRVGRALLRDEKPAAALRALDEAAAVPVGPTVAALRAEALLRLNHPADADALLDALPTGALAPAELLRLRAEVALAVNRADDARQLAQRAVEASPNDPALHHLLARACEAQQDWPAAARHYRRASELRDRAGAAASPARQ